MVLAGRTVRANELVGEFDFRRCLIDVARRARGRFGEFSKGEVNVKARDVGCDATRRFRRMFVQECWTARDVEVWPRLSYQDLERPGGIARYENGDKIGCGVRRCAYDKILCLASWL